MRKKLVKYLIHIQDKNRYPQLLKELKFFLPKSIIRNLGYDDEAIISFEKEIHDIRKDVLNMTENYANGVFVAVLDKKSVKYETWTTERLGNYVIGRTLMYDVIKMLSVGDSPSVYYDEGRLSISSMT